MPRITFRAIKNICLLFTVLNALLFLASGNDSCEAREVTLRVGLLNAPASLNYFGATDIWSKKIIGLLQMPLYVHDPLHGKMMPWLAADLPQIGPNHREVIIRLREAEWDDGTEVKASDLRFTVNVIQEFKVPAHIGKWNMVEKMEIMGPKKIRFVLSGSNAVFLNRTLFSSFVEEKKWASLVSSLKKTKHPLDGLLSFNPARPASNGPFVLDKYVKPYFILLRKNSRFFRIRSGEGPIHLRPNLDRIVFDFHPTASEAVKALEKGEIDFFWGDIFKIQAERFKDSQTVQVFESPRKGYDYMAFNLSKPPLNDPAFRQAISILIDREEMIRTAVPGGAVAYSAIPPYNTAWINKDLRTSGEVLSRGAREKKARNILNAAGYSWKNGELMLKKGKKVQPLELLTTCAGYKPYRMEASFLIKRWLSAVGISTRVRMRPVHTVLTRLHKRAFDLCLMGWGHLPADPGYLSTFFHSSEAVPRGQNYAGFKNKAFDRLAERATKEVDPSKRKNLVFQMQTILSKENPSIPLYARDTIEAVRKDRFKGWIKLPDGIGNLWSFLNLDPVKQAAQP